MSRGKASFLCTRPPMIAPSSGRWMPRPQPAAGRDRPGRAPMVPDLDHLEADAVRGRGDRDQYRPVDRRRLLRDQLDAPGPDPRSADDGRRRSAGDAGPWPEAAEGAGGAGSPAGRGSDRSWSIAPAGRWRRGIRGDADAFLSAVRTNVTGLMAIWVEDDAGRIIASSGPASLIAELSRAERPPHEPRAEGAPGRAPEEGPGDVYRGIRGDRAGRRRPRPGDRDDRRRSRAGHDVPAGPARPGRARARS